MIDPSVSLYMPIIWQLPASDKDPEVPARILLEEDEHSKDERSQTDKIKGLFGVEIEPSFASLIGSNSASEHIQFAANNFPTMNIKANSFQIKKDEINDKIKSVDKALRKNTTLESFEPFKHLERPKSSQLRVIEAQERAKLIVTMMALRGVGAVIDAVGVSISTGVSKTCQINPSTEKGCHYVGQELSEIVRNVKALIPKKIKSESHRYAQILQEGSDNISVRYDIPKQMTDQALKDMGTITLTVVPIAAVKPLYALTRLTSKAVGTSFKAVLTPSPLHVIQASNAAKVLNQINNWEIYRYLYRYKFVQDKKAMLSREIPRPLRDSKPSAPSKISTPSKEVKKLEAPKTSSPTLESSKS